MIYWWISSKLTGMCLNSSHPLNIFTYSLLGIQVERHECAWRHRQQRTCPSVWEKRILLIFSFKFGWIVNNTRFSCVAHSQNIFLSHFTQTLIINVTFYWTSGVFFQSTSPGPNRVVYTYRHSRHIAHAFPHSSKMGPEKLTASWMSLNQIKIIIDFESFCLGIYSLMLIPTITCIN